MVAAVDGVPMPQRYRRFRIKTVQGIDDTASMAEVVHRRYSRLKKENSRLPDLVVVDGGITQLRSARDELAVMGMEELPVIGLAERLEEIVIDKPERPSNCPEKAKRLKCLCV